MKHSKKEEESSSTSSNDSSSSSSSDSESSSDEELKCKASKRKHEKKVTSKHSKGSDKESVSSGDTGSKKVKKIRPSEVHQDEIDKRPTSDTKEKSRKTREQNVERQSSDKYKRYDERKYRENRNEHENRDNRRERDHGRYREHNQERYESDYRSRERRDYEGDRNHHKYRNDQRDRRDFNDRNDSKNRREDFRNKRDEHGSKEERYNKNRSRRSTSFDHANAKWGKASEPTVKKEPLQKDKPNFGLSGKLTEETNTYRGVVIKYSEPPEARKPKRRWRLYPFKGEKAMQTLYIHRESAYLIGRDRKVVDLPVDHPSCSKQHAALQYRLVPFTRDDGSVGKRVRPYLIDLDSANGTFINNKKVETRKYIELLEKDVIKFGFSSREYVLLHENSKDETQDDDVKQEEEVAVKNEPDE